MNSATHPIYCSGRRGALSRYLLASGVKPISADLEDLAQVSKSSILLLTYSATQRRESLDSFQRELSYYTKIVNKLVGLPAPPFIVYISSQTVIIDDQSLYARAKLAVEQLLEDSGLRCLILRPGFLFSDQDRLFIPSLSTMAALPISLGIATPCFSACRANDILARVRQVATSSLVERQSFRVEHLGVRLITITDVFNLQKRLSWRFAIPVWLLSLLALLSPKLNKIIQPNSMTTFPSLAIPSFYDVQH